VGTGFTAQSLAELHQKLRAREQRESPFEPAPRGAEARGVRWVRPELVAEIEYTERTRDGRVRHPSFRGLREAKPAMQVTREKPAPAAPRLTHPERVLYPELGVTKLDLARYYAEVAPFLLPHAAGRPLALVRCPEGRTGPSFFQKHPGRGT